MESGCHAPAVYIEPLAVLACDAKIVPDDLHRGDTAQTDDYARLYQRNLTLQPGPAGVLLYAERVAVSWRAALYDVCDIYLRAVKVDHFEHVVKQVTGGPDKGHALLVLLLAGTLADEHDLRLLAADAEHKIAPRLAQRTGAAGGTVVF